MGEYKRWKHAAWALVLMVASARDASDEPADDDAGHDGDHDSELVSLMSQGMSASGLADAT